MYMIVRYTIYISYMYNSAQSGTRIIRWSALAFALMDRQSFHISVSAHPFPGQWKWDQRDQQLEADPLSGFHPPFTMFCHVLWVFHDECSHSWSKYPWVLPCTTGGFYRLNLLTGFKSESGDLAFLSFIGILDLWLSWMHRNWTKSTSIKICLGESA